MFRVLVVEDEEPIRKDIVLAVDWVALGCVVVGEAANSEEALQAVERLDPSLIVTDINMPKLDGLALLRLLRERGNDACVILLTAHGSFACAQTALRLGAADLLLKPFRADELEQAVLTLQKRIERAEPSRSAPTLYRLKTGGKSKYVLRALDYVGAHYADPGVGVAAVAAYLGLSEGHLSHLFKRETDYTLLGYLTRYRMHRAMELLKDCRVKIYEVAAAVGYRDVAHFSATFKKLVGVSPREYQDANS